MSDQTIKISELATSTDLYDGCCMPVVTNDVTKKLTYALLKQKLQNDLDFPEAEIPEFFIDANGHLIAVYETQGSIDIGRVKGFDGQDGQDGQDGEDGEDGEDGNGIVSITKTGTSGNVDTYTITFTNGTTTTFTVTNAPDLSDYRTSAAQDVIDATKASTTALGRTQRSLQALWNLNKGQTWDFDVDSETVYAKTVPTGAHYDSVNMIGGKTIVWNQPFDIESTSRFKGGTNNGITVTVDRTTGKIHATGTAESNSSITFYFTSNKKTVIGHTYFLCQPNGASNSTYFVRSGFGGFWTYDNIHTITVQETFDFRFYTLSGVSVDIEFQPLFIDLTQMFGAGNEPSTVDDPRIQAIKSYALAHPEYDAGSILNAEVDEVESVGFNMFNVNGVEQGLWNESGKADHSARVRSTNAIRVEPSTTYYMQAKFTDTNNATKFNIVFFDSAMSYISSQSYNENYITFTTPSNCQYVGITFYKVVGGSTLTSYSPSDFISDNNDVVSLNISKTNTTVSPHNGEYYPYSKHTISIPQSVRDLCPLYGASAGSVYNYIDWERKVYVQNVGSVDLGTLTYSPDGDYVFFHRFPEGYNIKTYAGQSIGNLLSSLYQSDTYNNTDAFKVDKTFCVVSQLSKPSLFICNKAYTDAAAFKAAMSGVYLYHELAEPVEIDLSSVLPDDNVLDTEAGGTLTFKNSHGDSYRIPVPVTNEFIIKLDEVE